MNKAILFIVTGFFSVAALLPVAMPMSAEAGAHMDSAMDADSGMRKKRYRYRGRTHRVQVGVDFWPWDQRNANTMHLNVDLLYGYNGGYFEVGPNVSVAGDLNNSTDLTFGVGVWGEVNAIKNKRKKKFVPALGLKANYVKRGENKLLLSPYLSAKYFPASRTGLVLNVSYDIETPFNNLFTNMQMGIGVTLNYVHYFHF